MGNAVFKFVEPPEQPEKQQDRKSKDKFKIVSLKVKDGLEYDIELVMCYCKIMNKPWNYKCCWFPFTLIIVSKYVPWLEIWYELNTEYWDPNLMCLMKKVWRVQGTGGSRADSTSCLFGSTTSYSCKCWFGSSIWIDYVV